MASRIKKKLKNIFFFLITEPTIRIGLILLLGIALSTISIFFLEKSVNSNVKSFWDSFWYTIVTLTTTGYGDISPVSVLGRIVGILTMAFGVIVVAAVTGQIASFFVEQQLKRGKGLLKLKRLKNHFIICGWKTDFERIIDGILDANPDIEISDIVLINNASTEYMEMFMSNPKYRMMNYIHGDFIDESVLIRANIKSASKILILADQSGNYSEMEIDSRTVMTMLNVEKLNKNIYSAAELLDEKFKKYLEVAHCDEVLLTKEYQRKLIMNAASGTGVSHVIMDLLSLTNKRGILIVDIPDSFIGDSFKNLFNYFLNEKRFILIGLLENSGNFFLRKKEALNEAQKNPDISKIVENLQKVKEIKANDSVLIPEFDYVIKKHSKAITIGKTE